MATYRLNDNAGVFAIVAIVALWLTAIIGWILNIAKIVGSIDEPVTAMFIARAFGVVAPPFGAVLGYF